MDQPTRKFSSVSADWYLILNRLIRNIALIVMGFWLFRKVTYAVLLFIFSLILAFALNPPVTWLERKGLRRSFSTALVCLVVALVFGFLGYLVVPRISEQITTLWSQLPDYISTLSNRVTDFLDSYPDLNGKVRINRDTIAQAMGQLPQIFGGFLKYSLSFLIFLVVAIIVASLTVYILARPRPLLIGFLNLLPESKREPATRAFVKSAKMVQGWINSNIIVGGLEAVVSYFFLSWLGIPGALVWAVFTFFSELVPKLGPYLMAIPPTLVALAVDPTKGLYTLIFYIILNEVTGDTIAPWIRGKQMKIHPAVLIMIMLILTTAFGFMGALVSTPFAGFLTAIYEEFYQRNRKEDPHNEKRAELILERSDQVLT